MRVYRIGVVVTAVVTMIVMPCILTAAETPDVLNSVYTIGAGDKLEISIWKEAELSKQVIVLPDGTIHFPLVGELVAAGRTVKDLKAEIEKRIRPFVPEPVLSMSVREINSMLVYVIGKVNNPGSFELNSRIDALQALSMAGGLNPFAKEKLIRIYRKTGKKTRQFLFNYKDVAEGINLEQNILLERGDVIVVP